MVVDQRSGVEGVEQLLVPQAAEQADPAVGQGLDAGGVVVGVGGRSDDDQRQRGPGAHVPIHDDVDVVLHLEAGHDQVEALGSQVQLGQA